MKVIEQSHEILAVNASPGHLIEAAGRTCYKSESKTHEYSPGFVRNLIKSGHMSVIEHATMTVRFITDRGVTHELVRHRLASYSQESTRYCNYGNQDHLVFIRPVWMRSTCRSNLSTAEYEWFKAMLHAETHYLIMLYHGWAPEQARSVLPNSLKTEIVVTANMREWRHIFKLRALGTTGRPHPQIKALMYPLLKGCIFDWPEIFGDLGEPK